MNLQGTLFFDRMTEEVLDSIHANLQVSWHMFFYLLVVDEFFYLVLGV